MKARTRAWPGGVAIALAAALTIAQAAEPAAPGAPPPAGSAAPAGSSAEPPRSPEEYLLRLFTVACVAFARDPARTVEFADAAKMPVIGKPYAAMFLEGLRGAVWSASSRWGRYVLAVREDGTCAVYARKADTAAARRMLDTGLLAGIREHYTVVTDGPTAVRDGPTRQRWVAGTGQRDERLFIDFVASRSGAPFAAVLSVRLVNTGKPAPAGR